MVPISGKGREMVTPTDETMLLVLLAISIPIERILAALTFGVSCSFQETSDSSTRARPKDSLQPQYQRPRYNSSEVGAAHISQSFQRQRAQQTQQEQLIQQMFCDVAPSSRRLDFGTVTVLSPSLSQTRLG
ncbi:hypothetical protein VKT23_018133 [Stygiomarasmius scandens]|uniref:Uncharacterized protein n=1 Tax=Marasmiellus scandens TaxID=2682957 RepID=A0ABR1IU91_9AGAR